MLKSHIRYARCLQNISYGKQASQWVEKMMNLDLLGGGWRGAEIGEFIWRGRGGMQRWAQWGEFLTFFSSSHWPVLKPSHRFQSAVTDITLKCEAVRKKKKGRWGSGEREREKQGAGWKREKGSVRHSDNSVIPSIVSCWPAPGQPQNAYSQVLPNQIFSLSP